MKLSLTLALSIIFALITALPLHSQNTKPVVGGKARLSSWDQHLVLKSESQYKNLE